MRVRPFVLCTVLTFSSLSVLGSGTISICSKAKHRASIELIVSTGSQRPRRRKCYSAWERSDAETGGVYSRNLKEIATHYPELTPMELRVASMVKEMLPSWQIGQKLAITEKAVENYRVKIRRKTSCSESRLNTFLAKI